MQRIASARLNVFAAGILLGTAAHAYPPDWKIETAMHPDGLPVKVITTNFGSGDTRFYDVRSWLDNNRFIGTLPRAGLGRPPAHPREAEVVVVDVRDGSVQRHGAGIFKRKVHDQLMIQIDRIPVEKPGLPGNMESRHKCGPLDGPYREFKSNNLEPPCIHHPTPMDPGKTFFSGDALLPGHGYVVRDRPSAPVYSDAIFFKGNGENVKLPVFGTYLGDLIAYDTYRQAYLYHWRRNIQINGPGVADMNACLGARGVPLDSPLRNGVCQPAAPSLTYRLLYLDGRLESLAYPMNFALTYSHQFWVNLTRRGLLIFGDESESTNEIGTRGIYVEHYGQVRKLFSGWYGPVVFSPSQVMFEVVSPDGCKVLAEKGTPRSSGGGVRTVIIDMCDGENK